MGRIFLVVQNPGYRAILAVIIEHQSQHMFQIVGAASWDTGALEAIAATQPDVIVVVVGLDVGTELRRLAQLRVLAPAGQFLVIDTCGEVISWPAQSWAPLDALLRSEQLATELVPAISRLLSRETHPQCR